MIGMIERSVFTTTVGFGALWAAAAWVVEGTTFHLGPLIVAAAAPLIATKHGVRSSTSDWWWP